MKVKMLGTSAAQVAGGRCSESSAAVWRSLCYMRQPERRRKDSVARLHRGPSGSEASQSFSINDLFEDSSQAPGSMDSHAPSDAQCARAVREEGMEGLREAVDRGWRAKCFLKRLHVFQS